MLYGIECWVVKNQHGNKFSVVETRMLCGMCGTTRRDKIRKDNIRESWVASIVENMVETRLR
jgi:hypothetical protein